MYSVVLMAALHTSIAMPERHRGGGCCGCYGGGWGGCYGGWGGCYGGWGGGWGGCYGGFGMGCMGYGGMVMGGCYGGYPMMMGGCYGGGVILGGQTGLGAIGGIQGGIGNIQGGTQGGTPGGGGKQGGKGKTTGPGDYEQEESRLDTNSAQAVLVVSLPADARLLVDDKPTRSTGPTRVFVSPNLDTGRSYTYELKGEIQQDGRTRTVSQAVKVEPGKTHYVSLTFPTREVAQNNP